MNFADELHSMTPESFEKLPQAKRHELIAYNDEYVRVWRAQCQKCHARLTGSLHSIRGHKCHDDSE